MTRPLDVASKRSTADRAAEHSGSDVDTASRAVGSRVAVAGLIDGNLPPLARPRTAVDPAGTVGYGPLRRSAHPIPAPRTQATAVIRRMTIPAEVVGRELNTDESDFVDELRELTLDQLNAIADHLRGDSGPAQVVLDRVKRIITEHEGLAEEEDEEEDWDDEWAPEDEYDVSPAKMRGGKSKKKRKAKDKPPHTQSDDAELRAVARDYAAKIRKGGFAKEWGGLNAAGKRDFLKAGKGGIKMGDAVERIGEGKVKDRAEAEYGEGTRVWSSTKLRLRDTKGQLTGDLAELDYLIVDARGRVVSAVSAKTSPSAVAPAVDRGHLANYYGLPARFDDNQSKLELSRTLKISKEDLANKNELWFEYTEDGTAHTMPVTKFRTEHPLDAERPQDTRVMGLAPYSRQHAGPDRISLGLTEDEMFERLVKLIDADLPK